MSHSYHLTKSRHQKHPKVHHNLYLYSIYQPRDDIFSESVDGMEAELLQTSFSQKRRFRLNAQKMPQ